MGESLSESQAASQAVSQAVRQASSVAVSPAANQGWTAAANALEEESAKPLEPCAWRKTARQGRPAERTSLIYAVNTGLITVSGYVWLAPKAPQGLRKQSNQRQCQVKCWNGTALLCRSDIASRHVEMTPQPCALRPRGLLAHSLTQTHSHTGRCSVFEHTSHNRVPVSRPTPCAFPVL